MHDSTRADRLIPVVFRYFMSASLMQQLFDSYLPDTPPPADDRDSMAFLVSKAGLCMRLWYGALYVVVEAWAELGLQDTAIDSLLQSPNTDLLRRIRNSAFHFQTQWLSEKESDFYGAPDAVSWVRSLTEAFRTRLLAEMDRVAHLADGSSSQEPA